MSKTPILIVDDQQEILNSLKRLFKADYRVFTAASGMEGLDIVSQEPLAVILSDQRMPQMDGVTFLAEAKKIQPEAVRLMITGYADIEATIGAVNKANIYQYISKPFEPEELEKIVAGAVNRFQLTQKNKDLQQQLRAANKELTEEKHALQKQVEQQLDLGNLIGASPRMLHIFKLIKKVMNTPTTVLLLGDTGTGKEMLAKIIHFNSDRKDEMFIAQNCGAIPDTLLQSELFGHVKGAFTGANQDRIGRFEAAHKGTLFLDEIGDVPMGVQVKLLRVLENKEVERVGDYHPIEVNVRFISATHRNLTSRIDEKKFREDLYYRCELRVKICFRFKKC